MDETELINVYIFPDNEVYLDPPEYKSDDYVIKKSMFCQECGILLEPDYTRNIATCVCGTHVWTY